MKREQEKSNESINFQNQNSSEIQENEQEQPNKNLISKNPNSEKMTSENEEMEIEEEIKEENQELEIEEEPSKLSKDSDEVEEKNIRRLISSYRTFDEMLFKEKETRLGISFRTFQ